MTRDAAFDRSVALALQGAEAEVQRLFVAEIHQQLDRVYAESSPGGHTQWMDGRKGAAIETVKADGVAHFEFRYIPEVIAFAGEVLFVNSPVDEHPKADNIVFRVERLVFVNGVYDDVLISGADADDFKNLLAHPRGAEFTITDDEPYAGRLERGFSKQAPNGVYSIACDTVRRRYGELVTVEFRWRKIAGAAGFAPSMVIVEK